MRVLYRKVCHHVSCRNLVFNDFASWKQCSPTVVVSCAFVYESVRRSYLYLQDLDLDIENLDLDDVDTSDINLEDELLDD